MSNGDIINYSFAGLDNLSGDLGRHVQRLGELAEELKGQVKNLDANWQKSAGASSYFQAQAKFDSAYQEAQQQLHGLGKGVDHASTHMASADRMIANTFHA